MRKLKSVLKILFVAIFILSMLTACSDNEKEETPSAVDGSGTLNDDGAQNNTSDDDTGSDELSDGLDGLDFGGRKFSIYAAGYEMGRLEFEAEEETGAPINDAVYKRNLAVEERLGVELNIVFAGTGSGDVGGMAQRNVQAGDHVYDLYVGHAMRMGETALNNIYMDIYELGYIDFSKPWWPREAIKNMSYKDHAFHVVGEVNITYLFAAYCVFFNKAIAQDFGVPDLYQIALDGKWTLDKKNELARDVTKDLTGAGGALTENDQVGLTTTTGFAAASYMYGFGVTTCVMDNEGMPHMNMHPLMNDIVEKVYRLYYENPGVRAVGYLDEAWTSGDSLRLGNTFMMTHYLYAAIRLRDFETDFGILPLPKFDENQSQYYSISDGFHTSQAVPITLASEDFGFVGAVIESLNAESYKTVVPAYYDIALKMQGTRDKESEQVLEMIRDGRLVDFDLMYDGWAGFGFSLSELMVQRSQNFTSFYERRERQAQASLDKVIGEFERIISRDKN